MIRNCTPACDSYTPWGSIAPGRGRCHAKCDDTHQRPGNYATCVTVTEGAPCVRKETPPQLFDN